MSDSDTMLPENRADAGRAEEKESAQLRLEEIGQQDRGPSSLGDGDSTLRVCETVSEQDLDDVRDSFAGLSTCDVEMGEEEVVGEGVEQVAPGTPEKLTNRASSVSGEEQRPQPAASYYLASALDRLLAVPPLIAAMGEDGQQNSLQLLPNDLKPKILDLLPLWRYRATLQAFQGEKLKDCQQLPVAEPDAQKSYRKLIVELVNRLVDNILAKASGEEEKQRGAGQAALEQLLKELVEDIFVVLHEEQDKDAMLTCCYALAADEKLPDTAWNASFNSIVKGVADEVVPKETAIKMLGAMLLGAARAGSVEVIKAIDSSAEGTELATELYAAYDTQAHELAEQNGHIEVAWFLFALKTGREKLAC